MTIPAPLAPPTMAAVTEAAASSVGAYLLNEFMLSMVPGSPPLTVRAVVIGWTNHDGTLGLTNPAQCDPTARGADTVTARGLVAEYGAVTVVVFEWTAALPSVADVLAAPAVQAAANDPSSWVAPE